MSAVQSPTAGQWVPSLYFFQSMPFVVVSVIATLMYQQYGLDNTRVILLTSLLMLPWAIKPFIAPLLENRFTKKKLTVFAQLLVSVFFLVLSASVNNQYALIISILVFAGLALVSSVHDIVSDGVYLINLDEHDQKCYVGLRTVFFQFGRLAIKGGLVVLVAKLALYYEINVWRLFFFSLFLIGIALTIYHFIKIPETETARAQVIKDNYFSFFRKLFSNRQLYPILFFIFLYNFSEAQMQKIIPLFLSDSGLSLAGIGKVYGIAGSVSMMAGVFLSSPLLARRSVGQCLKILTPLLCVTHLLYLIPVFYVNNTAVLYTSVVVNQFIAGMANGVYMSYLLSVAGKNENPMSMYAFCTAIMALSYVFFGALSGWVEPHTGYAAFFLYIFLANILLVAGTYKMVNQHV